MLTLLYELILIYFVCLFVWNILEIKNMYKQIAIVFIIIPLTLRILFIK